MSGPYPMTKAPSNSITSKTEEAQETESIWWLSIARWKSEIQTGNSIEDLTSSDKCVEKFANKYVIEKIVDRNVSSVEMLCRLRWYNYPYENDTAETRENTPPQFIATIWPDMNDQTHMNFVRK